MVRMLDGSAFRKRLILSIAVAYFGPPVVGLTFIVALAQMFTLDQLQELLKGSILPYYIVGSSIAAIAFFAWYLRPVIDFADEKCDVKTAVARMRQFVPVYWIVFIARHLLGVVVVLYSFESVFDVAPTIADWARMLSLAVMLSSAVGLPVFVYITDFFAETFRGQPLDEPVLRVRTRVFLIAILLPLLLNTAVLQYLIPRLGGLTSSLLGIWVGLFVVAIVTAYNLMRSLDASMTELRRASQFTGTSSELAPRQLQVRTLDEFGVLTCEYRKLLTDLQSRTTTLDAHNRILIIASDEPTPEGLYRELLKFAAEQLESSNAVLVDMSSEGLVQVLAAFGDDAVTEPFTASEAMASALRSGQPTMGSMKEAPWVPDAAGDCIAIPLREAVEADDALAILAKVKHVDEGPAWAPIQLLTGLGPEIAAAIRSARVSQDRRDLQTMLQHSQRLELVGRLAAGVAHDFNNILMVIMGSAGVLKLELAQLGSSAKALEEHTDLITEASERATNLTSQLLAFSKPTEGKQRVLSVNEVIRGLEKLLRRLLTKDVEFHLSLGEVRNILADKGHVEQIITNLVVNARDAMPSGGALTIETKQDDHWIELEVIDTGTGMSEAVAAQAFDPFFTTKEKDKGTGLGLATVFGIVKSYGGTIDIESTLGKGTTMCVRLPMTDKSEIDRTGKLPALRDDGGRTVLLVEDDDHIRRIVGTLLTKRGHHVIEAIDGEEALEIIDTETRVIDLMISDVLMPGIDGTEVATGVAAKRPGTKILLMTGYADSEVLEAARGAGRAILHKPFTPEELIVRIDELLA